MNNHEVHRLHQVIHRLEVENCHLKEVLAEVADALYAAGKQESLEHELEALVLVWIGRANDASLKALTAERALNDR